MDFTRKLVLVWVILSVIRESESIIERELERKESLTGKREEREKKRETK